MKIAIHSPTAAGIALGLTAFGAAPWVIADEASQLEEVVVTAQRRSENLQKTPVAVTALSADTMEQRNVTTTQDLMQVTPGLQVATQTAGDSGGSATFFLRGMGQQRSGNGSEPAVGIYVDDIYYPSLEGTVFNILDLSQVEVLRGPQGTLFGRNTIGGAIRYTTQKPTDSFEASATATVGSYGRNDITGTLNLPISSILDVRLTVGRLQTSGYVRQQDGAPDAGGTQTELGRIAVRVKPTDNLTIDLTMQDSRQYLDGFPYTRPGPIVPGPLFPSWWNLNPTHAGNLYGNEYASQCVYCQAGTGANREFSDTNTPSGTFVVNWTIAGDLTVKSLTGWTKVDNEGYSDQDGSPLPIFQSYTDSTDTATSEEIQVNDKNFDDRLVWVGGLYYYHESYITSPTTSVTQALPPPGPGIPLQFVGVGLTIPTPVATRTTDSYAAYVNGTYRIFDKFSLLGGFRYSDDDKDATTVGFAPAHGDFSSNTWRAGGQYQWTDTVMSYATVSTGFRAGGFNPAGGTPPVPFIEFQPEYDRSYELGARMDFLDQRVRINPTVFYNNWTGIQVQSAVPVPGEGLALVLQNAGRAHTYGFELEAEAKLTQSLLLFANAATLDAHYDSIGSASGITVNSHFERAPTLTYAVGGTYTYDLPGEAKLRSTVNWSWEASQHSTPTDVDTLVLPSYGLLNGRIEYMASTHWTLAAFGTNLLNKVYYVGGVNYSSNVGSPLYDLGRPREWGASVRYSF
jgi:iron complex outermembrane recepter protein